MSFARLRGPGHPDVVCDTVAVAIVEEYLRRDPNARLQVQVSGGRDSLFINGEIASTADFDVHPIVQRVLAQLGVTNEVEPFVHFSVGQEVTADWREPMVVNGYATSETKDAQPPAYEKACQLARLLERERTKNPDWFWLGADYAFFVDDKEKQIWLEVEHVANEPIAVIRERLTTFFAEALVDWRIQINSRIDLVSGGLTHRCGLSGSGENRLCSSQLPQNISGVGRSLRHPLNLGAWLLRQEARRLLLAEKGKAIFIQAIWLPTEMQPSTILIRNEKGVNLSSELKPGQLDLSATHEMLTAPGWLLAALRAPFSFEPSLPWET